MMKKVLEYQRQLGLMEVGDRIVVGFSGGADSVCLLLVLEELKKQMGFDFCAVHVEHGIRGAESQADASFAKSFCEDRQIPFLMYHVDAPALASKRGITLEEAARELRYECFYQACEDYRGTKIAVAHHGDDNAETMLFHLARGTGIHGLAGIVPKRDRLIRPLLCLTRREIEAYLQTAGVTYCTDSTNEDVSYSRNRIRNLVMPQLLEVNPRAVEHMMRLSNQVEELYKYVERTAWMEGTRGLTIVCDGEEQPLVASSLKEVLKKGQSVEATLDKEILSRMEPVLLREFLHQVLGLVAGSKKDIGEIHVEGLAALVLGPTGKALHLPCGMYGTSSYKVVTLLKDVRVDQVVKKEMPGESEKKEPLSLEELLNEGTTVVDGMTITAKLRSFDGDCEKIPEKTYTKWFDYDKINGTVLLRNRAVGDYLMVNRQGGTKKLKEYFINEKIPQQRREQILLLADGAHVMWAIGYRISEAYKVTPKTKCVLEVHVEKEKQHG